MSLKTKVNFFLMSEKDLGSVLNYDYFKIGDIVLDITEDDYLDEILVNAFNLYIEDMERKELIQSKGLKELFSKSEELRELFERVEDNPELMELLEFFISFEVNSNLYKEFEEDLHKEGINIPSELRDFVEFLNACRAYPTEKRVTEYKSHELILEQPIFYKEPYESLSISDKHDFEYDLYITKV